MTEGHAESFIANFFIPLITLVFSLLMIPVLFLIGIINGLRYEESNPPWFYITQIIGNIGLYLTVFWIYKLYTNGLAYGHYPLVITGLILILASRIVFKVLDDQ